MKYSMLVLSLDEPSGMGVERLAPIAARLGLDGVELYAPSFRSLSWDYLKRMRDALDESGLAVSMISLSTNLVHPGVDVWLWNRSHVKVMCELAGRFKTALLRVTLGHFAGQSQEESLLNARPRLGQLLEVAEREGVTLAIENHPAPDVENRLEVLLEFLEAYPSRHLGLNYDPANCLRVGEDPVRNLKALAGRVVHLHAKNGYVTAGGEFVADPAVWRGQTDWKSIMRELNEAGYGGYLSIQYAGEPPEETVAKSLTYLRDLEQLTSG